MAQDFGIGGLDRFDDRAAKVNASDQPRVFKTPVFGLDVVSHAALRNV